MQITRRGFLGAAPTLAAAPAQVAGGKLRAGAATANITPLLGCSLAGNMTDRIAREVHDELHVRAIALDNGRARIAIAQVDSCVTPRWIFDRAKDAIRARAGIPPECVLLSATHTHSAPAADHLFQSVPDPRYTEWLADRIADCVRLAVGRLAPARAGWAVGREERLVFNRRWFMKPGTIPPDPFGRTTDRVKMNPPAGSPDLIRPAGPTDPDAGVLAIEYPDGRPLAVLGNYALHYVGGTGPGHVSADYFGAWSRVMERLAGAPLVASLSNGCSGNINGIDFRRKREPAEPYRVMHNFAEILAAECFRTWRTIQFHNDLELGGAIEELEFAVRLPDDGEVAAARRILEANRPPYKELAHIYARETDIMARTFTSRVGTPIQALRIGELGIATFPGEAFVELGLEVKEKSPFKTTFCIELANDYRGYIPTVEGHELGGYETWRAKSSYLEKEAAPRMVKTALDLLNRLA